MRYFCQNGIFFLLPRMKTSSKRLKRHNPIECDYRYSRQPSFHLAMMNNNRIFRKHDCQEFKSFYYFFKFILLSKQYLFFGNKLLAFYTCLFSFFFQHCLPKLLKCCPESLQFLVEYLQDSNGKQLLQIQMYRDFHGKLPCLGVLTHAILQKCAMKNPHVMEELKS